MMQLVGIKELKNKLTHYLKLTKEGDKIIVTDRGTPVAVIHSIDHVEDNAVGEERIAALGRKGQVRLQIKQGKLIPFKGVEVTGKPASEIILEERR
jgi:prevent-host-death family protein